MTNLQDVKIRRKSKIELGSEGKKSEILPSFLRFDGEKSSIAKARKVSMNHGSAQDDLWDAGPNMNEIMPAAYSSPTRHADQDDMKVQEVEDLY